MERLPERVALAVVVLDRRVSGLTGRGHYPLQESQALLGLHHIEGKSAEDEERQKEHHGYRRLKTCARRQT